jgi:hypothetical protein
LPKVKTGEDEGAGVETACGSDASEGVKPINAHAKNKPGMEVLKLRVRGVRKCMVD